MKNNRNFFVLSHGKEISLSSKTTVLKEEEVGALISSMELMEETKKNSDKMILQTQQECEVLKAKAIENGFNEGLAQWAAALKALENEHDVIRKEMESLVIKIAIKAAQMIVGKAIEEDPSTLSSIIAQSLRAVSEHKSVVIYCNPSEYDMIVQSKPELEKIIKDANTFSITPKQDLPPLGYIIQTEKGVINGSDPQKVWSQIETTFSQKVEEAKQPQ